MVKLFWLPLAGLIAGLTFAVADAPPPRKPINGAHVQKALPPSVTKDAVNLVKNGDFESGTITPSGWQTVDGLSSFWVKDSDPAHGKVLKLDTDVLQSQAYDWWIRVAGGASPKNAPNKLPTVEPKYDTLAGNDGVWFWSDPFPLEKGKAYWLTVDVKGPGLLVWLVGYPKKPRTGFGADEGAFQEVLQERKTGKPLDRSRGHKTFIHSYVWKGQMAAGGSDTWQTYSRRAQPFRPTAVTPNVRYGRIVILPTWPAGVYYVDNVRLVEVKDNGVGRTKD